VANLKSVQTLGLAILSNPIPASEREACPKPKHGSVEILTISSSSKRRFPRIPTGYFYYRFFAFLLFVFPQIQNSLSH
jgi:hypothetical protein